VNLVVTNVAGPPVPLYLAGARLLEVFPVLPVMGNLTLVVGVLSYAGQLNLTAAADPDGCPDVEEFAQGVRDALDDLASQAHGDPADGLLPDARPRKGATHVPASLA
jgi:diacylglycerol O-acyltransferase / wax synthase